MYPWVGTTKSPHWCVPRTGTSIAVAAAAAVVLRMYSLYCAAAVVYLLYAHEAQDHWCVVLARFHSCSSHHTYVLSATKSWYCRTRYTLLHPKQVLNRRRYQQHLFVQVLVGQQSHQSRSRVSQQRTSLPLYARTRGYTMYLVGTEYLQTANCLYS